MIAWMLKVNYILFRLCKIHFKQFNISFLFICVFGKGVRGIRTLSLWVESVFSSAGEGFVMGREAALRGRQTEATVFLLASVFKRHTLNMVLGICQRVVAG